MQNALPTPQWLELFSTAFGAKGLVALAWWAGAYHAERIRNLQGSYPILDISGDAGTGKTTLVDGLWKLSGGYQGDVMSASQHGFGMILRRLALSINKPVVIDDLEQGMGPDTINFETLKALYSGYGLRYSGQTIDFKGALAVVTSTGMRIKHMSTRLVLENVEREQVQSDAVKALYALQVADLSEFLERVKEHQDMAVFCMGKAEALAFELADQVNTELTIRDARNHAQLIALLDLLDVLFHVPAAALEAAKAHVREMAWQTVGRTRGPVED